MKRVFWLFLVAITLLPVRTYSKEGMWIPLLVERLNYTDLKANGFKLSPEDVYSVNKACLKDAIVIFGSGCTGEVISGEGLLLTNHHCGFSNIKNHSTVDKNYIREGFWAKSKKDELPNPGLSVKFLHQITEFTIPVLEGIDKSIPYNEQQPLIQQRIRELEKTIADTSGYLASIEHFYQGTQYYLFQYREYRDVRLVGAPPNSIGNFGGDPDNWIWPRHTGDFSLFRIYSDKNGNPAVYSEDNIPMVPKKFLTINPKGIQSGDFTMVLGYPGSTDKYLYSRELEIIQNSLYPLRIESRDGRLDIIKRARAKDEETYIQYSTKQNRISNAWKKWKGVQYGFDRFGVIQKRRDYEKWLLKNSGQRKAQLTELYEMFDDTYIGVEPYWVANDLFQECIKPIETFTFYKRIAKRLAKGDEQELEAVEKGAASFFGDFNYEVDLKLTQFMLWNFISKLDEEYRPSLLQDIKTREQLNGRIEDYFNQSVFTSADRFNKAFSRAMIGKMKLFDKDPIRILSDELDRIYLENVAENLTYYFGQLDNLNQEYIQLIMSIDTVTTHFPDANFTMRLSYGKVEPYSPGDAINYKHISYLDGVFQKEATGDEDYVVSDRLSHLFHNKDYGKYADSTGKLPTCFISSNHTSGGNSGSPVLNAYGELIGLNFDRAWEGTMSDFYFDEEICRNISVDIRYVLFLIDKFAGAGYLLNEMKINW